VVKESGSENGQSLGDSKKPRFTAAASLFVALGILLSRIAGLVRDRVFAHYLGNSDAAGAFKAALRIPNFLQNLFGEGVLSASFIPVYSRLRAEFDEDGARRVAGVVGSCLALVVSFLVLIGVLFTPSFVDLVAPGFHGELKDLTIAIVRTLFPGVGLLVMSAWCLGILNSHGRFFLSYFAPVLWNVAMITTLVMFGATHDRSSLALDLAWGSVVGSGLQLLIQLPFVFRSAGRIRASLDLKIPAVRDIFKGVAPVVLSRGVVQLSAYIDGMIASFLGASAVSSLAYAQTLYLLPISLFGMAVAAAQLPGLSVIGGDNQSARETLRAQLVRSRRNIAFFVIPSAVAFLLLGRCVVAAIYQTGQFGAEDTRYVWYILMGSVVGLLAATWGRLYSSAFYALRDTRTPFYFAMVRVSLTVLLGLLFAFPLRDIFTEALTSVPGLRLPRIDGIENAMGAVGLTASAGLAGWIEFLLLSRGLQKKIGAVIVPRVFLIKVWLAALIAGAAALALDATVLRQISLQVPRVHYNLSPVCVLIIFGLLYFVLATLLRIEELEALLNRVANRVANRVIGRHHRKAAR
jgi:putative peptidoglycan lipid II flippase